jgi:hypothetical protein
MQISRTGDTINDLFDNVNKFNMLAGNFSFYNKEDGTVNKEQFLAQLKAQAKCVLEEAKEAYEAIHNDNDPQEALDGLVDVLVTAYGLGSMLGLAGFNVDEACYITAENNMTKFPTDSEVVNQTLLANPTWVATEMQTADGATFVIKDEAGKIRKPLGYTKNNISECVPEQFKEGF